MITLVMFSTRDYKYKYYRVHVSFTIFLKCTIIIIIYLSALAGYVQFSVLLSEFVLKQGFCVCILNFLATPLSTTVSTNDACLRKK